MGQRIYLNLGKNDLILKIIPRDDVDIVHPGHQVPRRPLLSQYSYSATPNIPE